VGSTTVISVDQYIRTARPRGSKGSSSSIYDCPNCNGKRKLEVHRVRRIFYCHKCGTGGVLDGHPSKKVQVETEVQFDPAVFLQYTKLHPGLPGWKYLREKRNIPGPLIHQLRPHKGPSLAFVYFPLYELAASCPCYFIGRSILQSSSLRYLNPVEGLFPVTKTDVLWGLHRIWPREDELILCEGVFDAVWKRNRLALMGKTLSLRQLQIIQEINPKRVSVMLDSEARKEAGSLCQRLATHTSKRIDYFELPKGKDPDDMRDTDMERFRRRFV
jgi:hypothetical protein